MVIGPRRAGKSVSVKRAIARLIETGTDPRAITFCPCEGLSAQDLRRVIKHAVDLTARVTDEQRYWFFDEITYVPKWDETLKQLRDQTAIHDGCVVATGSSTADLRAARGELGGREAEATDDVRVLLPMGFRPFVRELYPELYEDLPGEEFLLDDIQSIAAAQYLAEVAIYTDPLAFAWQRYLQIGGFPRAVADAISEVDVKRSTVNSFWNIITGDVLRVGSMSDRDVKALLAPIVDGLTSPASIANIAQELSIDTTNAVRDRVDRICASMYAWRASVTHDGKDAVKGGQDKLYFIDPLIARLPSLRDGKLTQPDDTRLCEQQLGVTLLRAVARDDVAHILDESAVLVHRNPDSGAEIDFVGDRVPVPIEGKFVSKNWKPEKKAIEEHYGRGVIATQDVLDTSEDIWAVPAGALAWMVGDR